MLHFRYFLLIIFFACSSLHLRAQEKQKFQGLLWEISGNGLKKKSYLYGTMHVSNKVAFHLSDTFFVALNSCDVVALELNPDKWVGEILESNFLSNMMGANFSSYDNYLYSDFAVETPTNKQLIRSISKDFSFANEMLYRFNSRAENFEENTYLDLFIYQCGKKMKKEITGLENFRTVIEMSVEAAIPDQNEEPKKSKTNSYVKRVNLENELNEAYRRGDLDMLDSLSRMSAVTRKYQEYIIDRRNVIMANNLDSIVKSQKALFTAVGAAHLPGDKGIIMLLREKGYTVRAVSPKSGSKSQKAKAKIENTIYPLTYAPQTSSDSLFQIDLPGKLYELKKNSVVANREYLCVESVNGAYYSVTRVNTFAPLLGLSEIDYQRKVDSLLYESIPGKILNKKAIKISGFDAVDITNQTRRGDIQRYCILFTPIEVLIFKMGGTGNFVNSAEGEKVFSSIKIISKPNSALVSTKLKSVGFDVSIPGNFSKNTTNTGTKQYIQAYDAHRNYYAVFKTTYHDYSYIEEDTFELNMFAKEFYEKLGYTLTSKQYSQVQSYPAALYKASKNNSAELYMKLIIRGPHYYMLVFRTDKGDSPESFFNSFEIKDFEYPQTLRQFPDSSLFFTVSSPVYPYGIEDDLSKKIMDMQKKFKYLKPKNTRKNNFEDGEMDFTAETTGESVHLAYYLYDKFRGFSTYEELWKSIVKHANVDSSFIVKNKTIHEKGENKFITGILSDTNSTRIIKFKYIQHNSILYSLHVTTDSISHESAFVKAVFDSFAPFDDTSNVEPLVKNGPQEFFNVMSGKDSAAIADAVKSIEYIAFKNEDTKNILKLIEQPRYQNVSAENTSNVKSKLIKELSYLKHKDIIPFLEKLYVQMSDTTSVQLAILEALSQMKTTVSYKSFMTLLTSEPPLVGEYSSEIRDLFLPFYDSLKLSAQLFPDLLEFTRYREYKPEVIELLATLVDSNYVKPEVYFKNRSFLLIEANEELKRKLASEEKNKFSDDDETDYSDYDYRDYSYDYKSGVIPKDILNYYSTLLLPYMSEPKVQSFFKKMNRITDQDIMLNNYLLFLKNNKEVADSIWNNYAGQDAYRILLYQSLAKIKQAKKINKKYLTTESYVRSELYGEMTIKDTAKFIGREAIVWKGKKGFVYLFKREKENSDYDLLDCIGVIPVDSNTFNYIVIGKNKGKRLYEEDSKEILETNVTAILYSDRKRFKNKKSFSYNNSYVDELDYGY